MNIINAVVKEVGRDIEYRKIDTSLKSLQGLVSGMVETVPITDTLLMLVNEEGLLKELELNFFLHSEPIVGNAVFVGYSFDSEDFKSLSEKDLEYINSMFNVH